MSPDVKLFVEVPGPDTPGYLRRMIQIRDISDQADDIEELEPIQQMDAMLKMADFLKDYVRVEPPGLDKLEVLYDLSMNEFMGVMNRFKELANPPKKNTLPSLSSGSRNRVIVPH